MQNKLPKLFLFLFIIFYCLSGFTAPIKLSPLSEISVITCSPGDELYSVFGHSAIRVSDQLGNIDYVYNYGTFDFNTPNFYLKFARGKLDYMLCVETFQSFRLGYEHENRSVWEQVLDLSSAEKQRLYDLLEENYRPENKFYKYDFFYDNCSSRIRDIIQKALNKKVLFPDLKGNSKQTFRDLIEPYLLNFFWSDLGIDLSLGAPTDRIAKSEQYMFLPYGLQKGFAGAKIKNTEKKLVKADNIIFKAQTSITDTKATITPNLVFWGLFILVVLVSVLIWKKQPKRYWFDFAIFFIFGLLGIFMLLLWFATDHKATAWNFNLLWALPTHLIMSFLLLKKNKPRLVDLYFLGNGLLMLLLLIAFIPLPQALNVSTIPIILMLGLRSYIIFFKEKRLS